MCQDMMTEKNRYNTNVCVWLKKARIPTASLLCKALKSCNVTEERRGEEAVQSEVIARPVCTIPAISILIALLKEFYKHKPRVDYLLTQLMSSLLPSSLKGHGCNPYSVCLSRPDQDSWSSSTSVQVHMDQSQKARLVVATDLAG